MIKKNLSIISIFLTLNAFADETPNTKKTSNTNLTYAAKSLPLGTQSTSSEYIRPVNKMAKDVSDTLFSKKFDELETLAKTLRKKNVALSDGQPAIFAFYSGASKCVEMSCDDEDLPESNWIQHRALLDEWISTHPSSITAKLALARYLKEYAWKKRGLGFANTVSESQWKEFNTLIEESRLSLEKIKDVQTKDPIWYDTMLSILKIQHPHSKELDDTYNKAIKTFPYYLPYYFTKASEVSPRWGGSIPLFTAFVDATVTNTKAKLGETMYARLNWSSYDSKMFRNGQTDWNRMREGFLRMISDYPDPWNINNFAKFSCLAGDHQTLRKLMKQINDSPIPAAWRSGIPYQQCKAISERTL